MLDTTRFAPPGLLAGILAGVAAGGFALGSRVVESATAQARPPAAAADPAGPGGGQARADRPGPADDDEAAAPEPVLRVGRPAPPLHLKKLLQAPADAPATLDRLKGKAVVLEFWATWCAPCVEAFPHLNRLVEETKGEPVAFIAVTDESAEAVSRFLSKKTLSAWVGIDDRRATMDAYGVLGLPQTVLIDAQGVVRGITYPTSLTTAVLKDLAHGRPLSIQEAERPEPRVPAGRGGAIEFADASFLVYLGPPNRLGEVMMGPNEEGVPRDSVRHILQNVYFRGGVSPLLLFFDVGVPVDKEFGYHIRVPAGSGVSTRDLLKQALESTLGIRAVREQREMDVLLLKRIGEGSPPRAEGDPKLGGTVLLGDNFTRGQYSEISGLVGWLERVTRKPVIDETGLKGNFDWEFKVKSPGVADMNAALGKLGLSLSAERRRVEVIVIRKER
jgi:thiol-disulfide isomerase/thioredoxin